VTTNRTSPLKFQEGTKQHLKQIKNKIEIISKISKKKFKIFKKKSKLEKKSQNFFFNLD